MIDATQTEEERPEPTPYQNTYKQTLLDEDEPELNLSDLPEEAITQKEEGLINKEPEHDWQKRYSDLKSYHDRQKNEWGQQKELLEAKTRLAEQSKTFAAMPKTQEELEAFKEEYPDVYGVVEPVSRLQAEATTKEIEQRISQLQQKEEEAKYRTAEHELLALHPDFVSLKKEQEFLDWLDQQPSTIADAIYKNRSDAKWAARVIDLYKLDKGKINQQQPKSSTSAAEVVTKSKKITPSVANEGKRIWTADEISKLKPHEFEKLEKEIEQANREGRII